MAARRPLEPAPGQGLLPFCLHSLKALFYPGMAWDEVCCRDCGELLSVYALPLEVRDRLR